MEYSKTTGYIFNDELEARAAKSMVNNYYDIPVSEDASTRTWVRYRFSGDFYYIIYDVSLVDILGQPVQFEIPIIEENI